ncbi:MAG: NAD(P)(+) transhydrogenase (Re/Si-specific) subunit beta [Clostridiales bacterium]|nr:NAD(P)(+) transhydrogenase (Re/Si-specific) subunit beta [Clostridiales bacterium]
MITSIGYLITSVLFILGIMFLRSPATARLGNTLSALGMAVAIIATLLSGSIQRWDLIIIGFVLGAIIGYVAAMRVAMTAMPQMVAIFNGMGGGAAALVAINEILKALEAGTLTNLAAIGTGLLTVFIGSFSFAGSGLAFAKLQELIHGRPITFPLQKPLNAVIFLGLVILGIWAVATQAVNPTILTVFTLIALLLGFLVVLPIGGADMPVVISLLNAMTGLAAATTGFLLLNNVLIVAGALVGASGTILTLLMSRAMNRSVSNILFGAFGKLQVGETADIDKTVRSTTPEDVAALLKYAEKVIIVPGFGLAVARTSPTIFCPEAGRIKASGLQFSLVKNPWLESGISQLPSRPSGGQFSAFIPPLLSRAGVTSPKVIPMSEPLTFPLLGPLPGCLDFWSIPPPKGIPDRQIDKKRRQHPAKEKGQHPVDAHHPSGLSIPVDPEGEEEKNHQVQENKHGCYHPFPSILRLLRRGGRREVG